MTRIGSLLSHNPYLFYSQDIIGNCERQGGYFCLTFPDSHQTKFFVLSTEIQEKTRNENVFGHCGMIYAV
jgi:hypothetical protein